VASVERQASRALEEELKKEREVAGSTHMQCCESLEDIRVYGV